MKLAIFDLDGTLIDSSAVLVNAINYVRKQLHLEPMPSEAVLFGINNPQSDIANYFYGLKQIEPIHEQWFKEYYSRNFENEIRLFDGVIEMLEYLKSHEILLAIATNGYKDATIEALEHLNIEHYFSDIATFDDVKEPKPSPAMLQYLLLRAAVSTKDAIFVGDTKRDKLAAQAANIEFLQVDFGQNNKNVFTSPKELAEQIVQRRKNSVR